MALAPLAQLSLGALLALSALPGCLVGPRAEFEPRQRVLEATRAARDLEAVTRTPEHELDPSVSPDDARVAFGVLDRPDATPRVEVLTLGDGARRRLGAVDDVLAKPAWVDRAHVLVAARRPGDPYARPLVYPALVGGTPRPLSQAWANVNTVSVSAASGAPRFVQEVTADVFGWYSATQYDVHILVLSDVDGLGRAEISQGRAPSFSPSGRLLAYVGVGDRIFVADGTTGADLYYLMPGDTPAWSPDGRYLVFCASGDRGAKELFVVEARGGAPRALTSGTAEACHPSWSREGWIYFHANVDGNFDIYRLRPRLGLDDVTAASP